MTRPVATRKEKGTSGLIHAVALDPLDHGHPFHNGRDEGPDLLQISLWWQGFEGIGEPDAGVVEDNLHQHLLEGPGDGIARLVGQLLWNRLPEMLKGRRHAFEERSELGAGWDVFARGILVTLHPQQRQLLVDSGGDVHETLGP